MEAFSEPLLVVAFTEADCAGLKPVLIRAIRRDYLAHGDHPPGYLLDLADRVSVAVRGSGFRDEHAGQGSSRNRREFRDGASLRSSEQPVWLTAREAADRSEVSVEYMRRCCRAGDVRTRASRGVRSSWLIDAGDLAAWGQRRKDNKQKAA